MKSYNASGYSLIPLKTLPAVYIHIPFCTVKCDYCDFFSVANQDSSIQNRIVDQTLKQLDLSIQMISPEKIDTLYIGGGTPNSLNSGTFYKLIHCCKELVESRKIEEWTVELNPEHITDEMLKILQNEGVTRLSIGIQSFSDRSLQLLNRRATASRNHAVLKKIEKIWTGSWNLDLITALPGQTIREAARDLQSAVDYHPSHISLYNLTIEPDTRLWERVAEKEVESLNDKTSASFLEMGWEFLRKHSYLHYEISNFSRENEQSRHNLHYWRMHPYLGVGPGAVSTLPVKEGPGAAARFQVTRRFDTFLRTGFSRKIPVEVMDAEIITARQFLLEYLMMGLRTYPGIRLRDFQKIFNTPVDRVIPRTIQKAVHSGFLSLHSLKNQDDAPGCLSPTNSGMMFLDRVLLWAASEIEDIDVACTWPVHDNP